MNMVRSLWNVKNHIPYWSVNEIHKWDFIIVQRRKKWLLLAILPNCKVDTRGTAQNVVPSSSSGGGSNKGRRCRTLRTKQRPAQGGDWGGDTGRSVTFCSSYSLFLSSSFIDSCPSETFEYNIAACSQSMALQTLGWHKIEIIGHRDTEQWARARLLPIFSVISPPWPMRQI